MELKWFFKDVHFVDHLYTYNQYFLDLRAIGEKKDEQN